MKHVDLGDRRTYLGGSTIAAVLGLSPYQAPIDVWRFIHGAEPQEQTGVMRWGQLLEQAICDGYEELTGRRLIRKAEVRHPRYPFIVGHPDRIVIGEPGIFEAKASMNRAGYGEPGTDQVPPHVRIQCEIYMGLGRRQWCDVGLLTGTRGLDLYHIDHDPDLYESLIDESVSWWTRFGPDGTEEPPPDGTEAYRRHLAERFPRTLELELVATAEQALLIEELRAARDTRMAAEKRELELSNRIGDSMGAATVLVAPAGRCTFKPGSVTARWKDIAAAIATEAEVELAAFVDADREGREARPIFRFWPAKALEEAA